MLQRLAIIACVAAAVACTTPTRRVFQDERLLMGTRFAIRVVAADGAAAEAAMRAAFDEVARVEALLSEWRESSEISAVNRAAGRHGVAVGPELFEVVERSVEIWELTEGAFDITFAGCGRLWSFGEARVPERESLADCLAQVGSQRIELDRTSSQIFLPATNMQIGIAGIGKGYGVDRAADVLEARGITDYIVDGGGDTRIRGSNVDRPWTVGVRHPRERGALLGTVRLDRGAIVTSGDYEQTFTVDGVRYHHILDPATGFPARRSVAVTVIAPDATQADALATGLFVLGPERGIALAERLPDVEALILDPRLEQHRTDGFPLDPPVN